MANLFEAAQLSQDDIAKAWFSMKEETNFSSLYILVFIESNTSGSGPPLTNKSSLSSINYIVDKPISHLI